MIAEFFLGCWHGGRSILSNLTKQSLGELVIGLQDGSLPVINEFISPISRVITYNPRKTHVFSAMYIQVL